MTHIRQYSNDPSGASLPLCSLALGHQLQPCWEKKGLNSGDIQVTNKCCISAKKKKKRPTWSKIFGMHLPILYVCHFRFTSILSGQDNNKQCCIFAMVSYQQINKISLDVTSLGNPDCQRLFTGNNLKNDTLLVTKNVFVLTSLKVYTNNSKAILKRYDNMLF